MKRHRPPEPLLCKIPRPFPLLILISALISQSVSLASANVRAVASRRSSREQKQSRNGFPEDLENKITEIVRNSGAETVSVVYYDLANARELLINPDISFHAA